MSLSTSNTPRRKRMLAALDIDDEPVEGYLKLVARFCVMRFKGRVE